MDTLPQHGAALADVAGTAAPVFISPADRWGPFASTIDEPERRAQLRALRAIAHLCLGPRGERLSEALRLSERDSGRLPAAVAALNSLAALDRRQVLATFARLHRGDR